MATCHVPDCSGKCASKMFMCKEHWFMVPEVMRKMIWKMYKPSKAFEEELEGPTTDNTAIFKTAIAHVKSKEMLRQKQLEAEKPPVGKRQRRRDWMREVMNDGRPRDIVN